MSRERNTKSQPGGSGGGDDEFEEEKGKEEEEEKGDNRGCSAARWSGGVGTVVGGRRGGRTMRDRGAVEACWRRGLMRGWTREGLGPGGGISLSELEDQKQLVSCRTAGWPGVELW